MTPGQIAFFCQKSLKNHDALAVQSLCLIEFSDLKFIKRLLPDYYEFKKGRVRFKLDADRFTDLLSRLDFLQQPPGLMAPPDRIKGCDAPDARLYGVRLDQWLVADTFYTNFVQSHDPVFLDKLITVLYARAGESWDNGDHVAARAVRFYNIPYYLKHWVFLWYTGVKLWLMVKYSHVFSGGTGEGSDTPADEVVMGVIRSLNGGHLSNNDRVKGSDVHEALFELNKLIEENQKTTKQHV